MKPGRAESWQRLYAFPNFLTSELLNFHLFQGALHLNLFDQLGRKDRPVASDR
jgi:hypothetical protein